MEVVFETLSGRRFLTDLLRNPGNPCEFGSSDRYDQPRDSPAGVARDAYQRAPMSGCPDALCSMLRLMQRYLHDFYPPVSPTWTIILQPKRVPPHTCCSDARL